jgi:acylphosphatase
MSQSQNSRTLSLFVEGLVQGVGYRRFAQRTARSLGLTGWTRNLSDGRVEIRVTGPAEALDLFCKELPKTGRVDGIEKTEVAFETFVDFEIRRDG